MKLSRLYTFITLAELKSFSLVAERLELTQPAVSIQIKSLEEYFGVQMVERHSDGIILTPEGEVFYREAREMVRIWEGLRQKINKMQDLVKGSLSIGASTIPAEYILPQQIATFCRQYPLIELYMDVGDSQSVMDGLLKKRFDLGIVGSKPQTEELIYFPIASDEMVLIVPQDHSLATREVVEKGDLLQERFVIREEGSGTLRAMREGLAQIGLRIENLEISAHLGSTEAVIAAVESGLGISVVSSLALQRPSRCRGVVPVKLKSFSIQRQFYLVYIQESLRKVQIEKCIEFLKELSIEEMIVKDSLI